MEERVVYTVDEVASLLGISRPTAHEGVKTGKIPSIKIGRRILIPRAAFEKMLAKTDRIQVDYPEKNGTNK